MRRVLQCIVLLMFFSYLPPAASEESSSSSYKLYPGLKPITESIAYKRYQQRPNSELSKLIYLIDRFVEANFVIIYDRFRFTTGQAGNVARWFLKQFYQGQTGEQWIYQWCNKTVPGGEVIWVELPDGTREMSRIILLNELEALRQLERNEAQAI